MRDPDDTSTLDIGLTTLVGYARVSTPEQSLAVQLEALEVAGCHKIFSDVASGARAQRTGLDEALNYLRPGDTLVVLKVDRLGRSISHLVQVIDDLRSRKISFKSLNDSGLDTNTPNGKLLFNLFAMLADFERELIRERTKAGLASARARGRIGGRRLAITTAKLERAKTLIESKGLSVREAAAAIKVGKSTLYNALQKESAEKKGTT